MISRMVATTPHHHLADTASRWPFPDIGRRMLPLPGPGGSAPGPFQRSEAHHLHIVAVRPGGGMQVADKIIFSRMTQIKVDDAVDDGRIYKGTVAGDLDHGPGGIVQRRLVMPVQQIVSIAAETFEPFVPANGFDRIIVFRRGSGDDDAAP